MCRLCGREACAECFQQVSELTTERPDAPQAEIAALQAKREKHAHVNPFFLSCTRRNEHRAADFSPMSRFSKDELGEAITEMEALLTQPEANGEVSTAVEGALETSPTVEKNPAGEEPAPEAESSAPAQPSTIPDQPSDAPSLSLPTSDADPDTKPIVEMSSSDSANPPEASSFATTSSGAVPQDPISPVPIPTMTPLVFSDTQLTDEVFAEVWAKGEPLVVTDLMHKFRVTWTPEYFSQKYGTQTCLILECQTDQNKRVSVGEFFSWFGKYEGRRDCWKLKVCSYHWL